MIIVDPLDRYFPLFGKKQEPKKKEVHGEGFQQVLDEEMKKLSASASQTQTPNLNRLDMKHILL